MKVFSVAGFHHSGKTTTVVNIIKELKNRGYSVGTIKDIHFEGFSMDTEGKNTFLHRQAGAEIVTARGLSETDILNYKKLPINELLKYYNTDYVIIEGSKNEAIPKIITAKDFEELEKLYNGSVFLASGIISNENKKYKNLEILNSNTDIKKMVDIIEEKVFDVLPLVDSKCCNICGGCKTMCENILNGKNVRDDCAIKNAKNKIQLSVDGKNIEMVGFVQDILYNEVMGVVKELKGYKTNSKIKIEILS